MEAGDGRWGQVAAGLPCLLELETDTMGNAMRWTKARVTSFTRAQVINLCGPKQVQSVDYLLRAASISRLAGCVSALRCKIGPNSGLMHLQHPAVRRQTLSLQSEKRLSGSGECFKFSQAGVSLSLSLSLVCYYPTGSDKNSGLEPRAQVKTLAWAESATSRPGQPAQSWLA